jgi:hypothetical protein
MIPYYALFSELISKSIWGADVYTGDSLICRAEAPTGLITVAAGGWSRSKSVPIDGSIQNGIPYEHWVAVWPNSVVFIFGATLRSPAPAEWGTGDVTGRLWVDPIAW